MPAIIATHLVLTSVERLAGVPQKASFTKYLPIEDQVS